MRIAIGIAGYLSMFFGVPWITALCILLLAIRYRAWEALLLGFFMDLLWLPADIGLYTFPYFTLISLFLVWAFEPLRLQFLR